MHRASFVISYYDQQMHNYLKNYHTPDVSKLSCHPQGACNQYLAKLHKYFRCSCWNNSCIWNTCVPWKGIDYKLPEDDTIVSKHLECDNLWNNCAFVGHSTKRIKTVIKFPVTFNDELSTVLPLRQLNYELLLIRKKAVMTYLEALSWNLFEETEYNKERLQSRQQLNCVSSQTSLRRYRYINLLHNYYNFPVIFTVYYILLWMRLSPFTLSDRCANRQVMRA